jgi:hypothetical protein
MMSLTQASSYFDRTAVSAPDTGQILFMGQLEPYDDSKRDAASAYRRILSVKSGTPIPASRVVKMFDKVWIIGASEPDGFEDIHRVKYVTHYAPVQLKVSRPNGFLFEAASSTLWASPQWIKDSKQLETSSDIPQIFDIALPDGSDVRVHDVLWATGMAFLILATHLQASGLLVANSLKLDQIAPATAGLVVRTYNPVNGNYTNGVTVQTPALLVRWQSLFAYGSQSSERYQEGDVSIILPTGTAASTGTTVDLAGVTYQAMAVLDVSGAVVLHARVL